MERTYCDIKYASIRNKSYKYLFLRILVNPAFLVFILSAHLPQLLFAGSLNPAMPFTSSTTGYTLSDVYARISSGTSGLGYYSLSPSAGPASTGVTLDQIYNSLPSGTSTSASAGDVYSGKTFITRANSILGISTGTLVGHELPDTGKTTIHSANDDGSYNSSANQPGYTMYNYISESYVQTADVNIASVTVDNNTGLMWVSDGNLGGLMTWSDAITWCEGLDYAGYTDWRMPNCKELFSIVNFENTNPSIDTSKFRNTLALYYWTSTTYAGNSTHAWFVLFDNGYMNEYPKTESHYVRPVRSGP